MLIRLLLILFMAHPAYADPPTTADPIDIQAIGDCVYSRPPNERTQCYRVITRPCTDHGNDTTQGMIACNIRAALAWEVQMELEFAKSFAFFAEIDATNDVYSHDMRRTTTLHESQRAWEAYRTAECRNAEARWGQGTMGEVDGSACRVGLAAERTIALMFKRISGE